MKKMSACWIVIGLLMFGGAADGCLWDSDTLKQEAKGLPEVVDVIFGRFDRNPSLYYEMRLERVSGLIADDPTNLEAYDDAGVACDRLGRSGEAIEWMRLKKVQLDKSEGDVKEKKEHRYRYLANLGTFYAHRWLRGGADRSAMEDMIEASKLIGQAIEVNPEAHFGREKYQLQAIDWVIKGGAG